MQKTKYIRLKNLIWQKLVLPLLRSNAAPEEKARGVAVGLAWAMTPLVGVQMITVLLTWSIALKLKWRFSLPLALAWTWVTNVVTMVPIYYVFYVTGQIIRMQWDNISGFHSIARLIEHVFMSENTFWEKTKTFLQLFIEDWGVSLFVGCIPYIFICFIGGYYLTMRFELMRKRRKEKNGKISTFKSN